MRICTDKEAFDLGFDPAVARVVGDSNYMEIKSTLAHNEHTLGYPISVDRRIQTLGARLTIPPALYALKFESKTPDDRRVKARFLDVMGINPFTPDGGILLGFECIVSESARDKLAPYLKDECSFIPVAVSGVPQPYYILWVHQIEDALDEERSRLGDDDFVPGKKRPFRAVFHLDQIKATYLFRVPQWKYEMDCDLALKPFRELVYDLKITGFTFQAGGEFGPLLK